MKAEESADIEKDGFSGLLYARDDTYDRCIIVLIGDENNDIMNKACAAWLLEKTGVSALCIGVRQHKDSDTGVHSWSLDHIENAVRWLKERGIYKIGILGMSMQASMALTSASLINDISLVIGLSPNDFVPWGFYQGKINGSRHGEWPSGTSAFSWRAKELPYQPPCLEKDEYWKMFIDAKKEFHEMHSKSIFEYSESICPVKEDAFIKIENINGRVVLAGAKDDSMWDSARYIERMKARMNEKSPESDIETYIYEYGTHMLVPEGMVHKAISVFGDMISRIFESGKKHPKECRKARVDLEQKLIESINRW